MAELALQFHEEATTGDCALCGKPVTLPAGMQLSLATDKQPVCPCCGQQRAPALAALLGLATTAERVGRIGQHTISPPMSALLDLARAAEKYTIQKGEPGASPPG